MTPQPATTPEAALEDQEQLPSITEHPGGIRAGVEALAQVLRERSTRHVAQVQRQVTAWLEGEDALEEAES